jgi:hypothetical protein
MTQNSNLSGDSAARRPGRHPNELCECGLATEAVPNDPSPERLKI